MDHATDFNRHEDAEAFELDRRLRRAVQLEQMLDATIAPLLRRLRRRGCGGDSRSSRGER